MTGTRTRAPAPDRDELRGIASEVARAAVRFLAAHEEGIPPSELPPIRSPVGAVGPARWSRLVRGSRRLLLDRLDEGRLPVEWPRLPPAVVDALGRRVAFRYGLSESAPASPLLTL